MPGNADVARLFLDANVIYSAAHNPDGRCGALFALAESGTCHLLASAYAAAEAERNLRHKNEKALKHLEASLKGLTIVPEPDEAVLARVRALGLDEGDVAILGAALGRADILVTGDRRHFGRWMGQSALGIRIFSPAQALAALL